jgi:hypothetical protein
MVSSNLKQRMQGKSGFNFGTLDEALFAERSGLTKAGVEKDRAKNRFKKRLRLPDRYRRNPPKLRYYTSITVTLSIPLVR